MTRFEFSLAAKETSTKETATIGCSGCRSRGCGCGCSRSCGCSCSCGCGCSCSCSCSCGWCGCCTVISEQSPSKDATFASCCSFSCNRCGGLTLTTSSEKTPKDSRCAGSCGPPM